MPVRFGFYNSLGGDRKYNAMDFSRIFDGIIKDGVFMSIGTSFAVKASEGMIVNVGIGRAWFNGTWTYNDAILPIRIEDADILLNRIDAVVIEVNLNDNVRENAIKVIKGTAASNPVRPLLSKENKLYQYPLAYIRVNARVTEITQSKITSMIGTSYCPYVTGILETVDVDDLVVQWEAQWTEWIESVKNDNEQWTIEERAKFDEWTTNHKNDMDAWIIDTKTNMEAWMQECEQNLQAFTADIRSEINNFKEAGRLDFADWFNNLKIQLDGDVAGNLQNQIDSIVKKEFDRFYSIHVKNTAFEKDANGKVLSIIETTDEATSTTTFVKEKNKTTITTVLVPTDGNHGYVKNVIITKSKLNTTINETFVITDKNIT